jgi:hypothetical protein
MQMALTDRQKERAQAFQRKESRMIIPHECSANTVIIHWQIGPVPYLTYLRHTHSKSKDKSKQNRVRGSVSESECECNQLV